MAALGEDPAVAERDGAELDPDLVLQVGGVRADLHLPLETQGGDPLGDHLEPSGHDPIHPIGAHEIPALVLGQGGPDADPLGTLLHPQHPLVLADLGAGPSRLPGQEVVEAVAHDHVGHGAVGPDPERIQPLEGERGAIDPLLDEGVEIRLQDPVNLERQAPTARLVAGVSLLLQGQDPVSTSGQLVGCRSACRSQAHHDHVECGGVPHSRTPLARLMLTDTGRRSPGVA